ncbi:MAG TPA: hypothetical protein VFZ65_05280 [Planctomycetota bacterium]|nr:hypothetical protein [Planctomycetota bacterium]
MTKHALHLLFAVSLPCTVALAQAAPATGGRVAKIYEVGDLVDKSPPGPDLHFTGTELKQAGDRDTMQWTETEGPAPRPGAIVRLLQAFVKPPLAANEEIRALGERWIVVLARPEQHAWIERFLQATRGSDAQTFQLECSYYSAPELVFLRDIRDALVPKGGTGNGADEPEAAPPKFVSQVLAPGPNTDAFLKALPALKEVTTGQGQGLVVWPLTTGHVAVVNQTAYVRDFDVEVAQAAFIANPIIDVVQDGITIEASVAPLADSKLGLSIEVRVADLIKPIPTFTTSLGGSTVPVTIQLPNVQSTQLEAAFELQPGSIVVLAPPPLAGKRHLFVVKLEAGAGKRPK